MSNRPSVNPATKRFLPKGGSRDPHVPADAKADAEEWDRLLRNPPRVSWSQASELFDAIPGIAKARRARASRAPW
jgi:hypothetical protein